MDSFRIRAKSLVCLVLFLAVLTPLSASANPVVSPLGRIGDLIIFGLVISYIILIEGTVIKIVLFGHDEISWPGALLIAAVLNVLSAITGYLAGVYYDLGIFQFEPNLIAVLGLSLAVEGIFLYMIYSRRRPRKAIITVAAMNAASYVVLVMARFPGDIFSLH